VSLASLDIGLAFCPKLRVVAFPLLTATVSSRRPLRQVSFASGLHGRRSASSPLLARSLLGFAAAPSERPRTNRRRRPREVCRPAQQTGPAGCVAPAPATFHPAVERDRFAGSEVAQVVRHLRRKRKRPGGFFQHEADRFQVAWHSTATASAARLSVTTCKIVSMTVAA